MSLVENTLYGRRDMVATAIAVLREFHNGKPFYLCFSGGKDSCVCDALLKMSGLPYAKHFQRACEPPEVIRFIQQHHSDTIVHRPAESMWTLISCRKKNPPLRQGPWCCRHLKETQRPTDGTIMVQGVRWAESHRRATIRKQWEPYATGERCVNPIIGWSDDEVWEFIHKYSIPYCRLYDEGRRRIGCVLCPQQGQALMRRDAARWPKIAAAYVRALGRAIENRRANGLATTFISGQEWFDWWIGSTTDDPSDCALPLYDN